MMNNFTLKYFLLIRKCLGFCCLFFCTVYFNAQTVVYNYGHIYLGKGAALYIAQDSTTTSPKEQTVVFIKRSTVVFGVGKITVSPATTIKKEDDYFFNKKSPKEIAYRSTTKSTKKAIIATTTNERKKALVAYLFLPKPESFFKINSNRYGLAYSNNTHTKIVVLAKLFYKKNPINRKNSQLEQPYFSPILPIFFNANHLDRGPPDLV